LLRETCGADGVTPRSDRLVVPIYLHEISRLKRGDVRGTLRKLFHRVSDIRAQGLHRVKTILEVIYKTILDLEPNWKGPTSRPKICDISAIQTKELGFTEPIKLFVSCNH